MSNLSDLRARALAAVGTPSDPVEQLGLFAATDELRSPSAPTLSMEDSGIPAEMDVPVHVAWSRVMGEVQHIGKVDRREDRGGSYDFRGIDAVLNAVGPAIRKHGVLVLPVAIEPEYSTVITKAGAAMNYCRAIVTFAVFGPRGDVLPRDIVVAGEAFDTGDKSSTKAQSVALRTAYINALAIPTREPGRDTEHGPQYEMAAPAPPTPIEYRDEILDPRTSRTRMLQIRRELTGHPTMGSAMVNSDEGAEMSLLDLCAAVGRARFSGGQP